MKAAAQVAVIIPVLNEAEAAPALAARAAAFSAAGAEVIFVDGGSRDGTADILAGAGARVVEAPAGRGTQQSAGAAAASRPLLLFLHADTELPATAFDGVRAPWGRFDVRLDAPGIVYRIIECGINWRSRLTGIATGDQAIFVSRTLLAEVGGIPDQPLMEDVELCSRLRSRHRPICLRAKVVTSARRWQRDGVLTTVLLMWRLRYRYWRGATPEEIYRRYYRQASGGH